MGGRIHFTDIPFVRRDGQDVAREVSDATYCRRQMWIVDNEDDQNLLRMTKDGRFSTHPLRTNGRISDLEGITSDGESLYLTAGGGLSRGGKIKPERFAMARVTLRRGEPAEVRILDMLEWLLPIAREIDMKMEEAKGTNGDTIHVPTTGKFEGLAMMPDDRLLMGIRRPLVKDRAVILQLDGYREAFAQGKASRIRPKIFAMLDLGGRGISAMDYDHVRQRLLVLGIHEKKRRTDLYAWTDEKRRTDLSKSIHGKPARICKFKGHKAEGVARFGRSDSSPILTLCDDEDPGGHRVGRYAFITDVGPSSMPSVG